MPHYTRTNTQNTPPAMCAKTILISVVWSYSFLLGSYIHEVTFKKPCQSLGYVILRSSLCAVLFHRIGDNTFTATSDPSACFGRTTFETRVDVQCSRNISSSALRIFRSCIRLCGGDPHRIISIASIQGSSYSENYRKKCNDNIFLHEQNRQR